MYDPKPIHLSDGFYVVEKTGFIQVNKKGEVRLRPDFITLGSPVKRRNKYAKKSDFVVGIYGKTFLVHRLVAYTFLPCEGNPDELDVNHIDGNPSNNRVENLEWVSRKKNNEHAVKIGENIQADRLKVKNLFTGEERFFYSIQHCAKFFKCAGGSVHNYVKNWRFKKPFRGHFSVVYSGESYPEFDDKLINQFGGYVKDSDVIILLSMVPDRKNIVVHNYDSAEVVLGKSFELGKDIDGYIPCHLKDISLFSENIEDVLKFSNHRYDLLSYNKTPNNTVPKKIHVTNKSTNEIKIYNSVREFAEVLNMTYSALKKSIWRTKGDFRGYYIKYIK